MNRPTESKNAFFSFLDHFNFIEDDSSSYEVGISDEGFSYLDLASEKKMKAISFQEKQKRETGAATRLVNDRHVLHRFEDAGNRIRHRQYKTGGKQPQSSAGIHHCW